MNKEELKEEILKYLNQGKSIKDIAQILGRSNSNISTYKSMLIEEGKFVERKKDTKKEKILQYFKEGRDTAEIARLLNIQINTVYHYKNRLVKEGLLAKQSIIKQKVEEKLKQGKSIEEIAKELDKTVERITSLVYEIKREKNKRKEIKIEQIRKEIENYLGLSHQDKLFQDYLEQESNKDKPLSKEEIETIKQIVEFMEPQIKNVIIFWNICAKNRQIETLDRFLVIQIRDGEFKDEDTERLKELKSKLDKYKMSRKVLALLKENESISRIIEMTGASEAEINQIKRKLEKSREVSINGNQEQRDNKTIER